MMNGETIERNIKDVHFGDEFLHLNRASIAILEAEYNQRKHPEKYAMMADYYKRLATGDTRLFSEGK